MGHLTAGSDESQVEDQLSPGLNQWGQVTPTIISCSFFNFQTLLLAGIQFVQVRTGIILLQGDAEGSKVMSIEPLVDNSQRSYQRARFAILSEGCPFDDDNPATCPMHEIRERSLKERMVWFDELSEKAFLAIDTHCRLCLKRHIMQK